MFESKKIKKKILFWNVRGLGRRVLGSNNVKE